MPDSQKCLVIGGGLAGVTAAFWAARQDPAAEILLVEKEDRLAAWLDRMGKQAVVLGSVQESGEGGEPAYVRGAGMMSGILRQWPGSECLAWLASAGLCLELENNGTFRASGGKETRATLVRLLEEAGVQVRLGYAVEAVSARPGGGFRVWSRAGEALEASCLLLATGGERNHGMKLAREWGVEVEAPFAGYARLRLASPKTGERLGPMAREAGIRCVKTGETATGLLQVSARGLEGDAVSALSARLCETWLQMRYRFRLEVDWLPEFSVAAVRSELDSRTRRGSRRPVGEDPLFHFNQRQWDYFLESARVDADLAWPRLKAKKLQALVQRLKGDPLTIAGMGLPAGERAWAGGVRTEGVNRETGESLATPGIFHAGEILDILGLPGGPHLNMAWATGYLAGSAMVLRWKRPSDT
ncbi:MAG: aminoacetone oxidase family FAD-binding enzyme [Oceanipulchritudo sp.]